MLTIDHLRDEKGDGDKWLWNYIDGGHPGAIVVGFHGAWRG